LAVTVAGVIVAVVAVAGLAGQAVRGNRTVAVQQAAVTVHDTSLQNAYYQCLDVQVHSLVSPNETVTLYLPSLSDLVTLLMSVGSWVKVADPPMSADARISLRSNVSGNGACLGTVAVAHYAKPHHGVSVRVGSGAQIAGEGSPPPSPL
jgi:hypothetical protein